MGRHYLFQQRRRCTLQHTRFLGAVQSPHIDRNDQVGGRIVSLKGKALDQLVSIARQQVDGGASALGVDVQNGFDEVFLTRRIDIDDIGMDRCATYGESRRDEFADHDEAPYGAGRRDCLFMKMIIDLIYTDNRNRSATRLAEQAGSWDAGGGLN